MVMFRFAWVDHDPQPQVDPHGSRIHWAGHAGDPSSEDVQEVIPYGYGVSKQSAIDAHDLRSSGLGFFGNGRWGNGEHPGHRAAEVRKFQRRIPDNDWLVPKKYPQSLVRQKTN